MLILGQHVGSSGLGRPDQFIPGSPQGLMHGQFIQVRDYICVGTFIPLVQDISGRSFQQLTVTSSSTCAPVTLMNPPPATRPSGQNLYPEVSSACPLLLLQHAGVHRCRPPAIAAHPICTQLRLI